MASEASENLNPSGVRELKLGNATVKQKGRVSQLEHPDFGTTFLIDVTDREDPTAEETVRELLEKRLNDPQFLNCYSENNGVVALITDQLDQDKQVRVYVGVIMVDEQDQEAKEITSYILEEAGFKAKSFDVPMSFDSDLVRTNIGKEIAEATKEAKIPNLFSDFRKLLR